MEDYHEEKRGLKMSKNGIWEAILGISLMILAIFLFFAFILFCANGCKELPQTEIPAELEIAMCIKACELGRQKTCEELNLKNLSPEACEPACRGLIDSGPIPDWGCILEAATCEKLKNCFE